MGTIPDVIHYQTHHQKQKIKKHIYEQRTTPITSAKGRGWNGHRFLCVPHRSWGSNVCNKIRRTCVSRDIVLCVSPLSFLRVSWWYQVSMSWCNCSKMSEVLAGAHILYMICTECSTYQPFAKTKSQEISVKCHQDVSFLVIFKRNMENMLTNSPSWWLNQPIWKICSSNWKFSPNI